MSFKCNEIFANKYLTISKHFEASSSTFLFLFSYNYIYYVQIFVNISFSVKQVVTLSHGWGGSSQFWPVQHAIYIFLSSTSFSFYSELKISSTSLLEPTEYKFSLRPIHKLDIIHLRWGSRQKTQDTIAVEVASSGRVLEYLAVRISSQTKSRSWLTRI